MEDNLRSFRRPVCKYVHRHTLSSVWARYEKWNNTLLNFIEQMDVMYSVNCGLLNALCTNCILISMFPRPMWHHLANHYFLPIYCMLAINYGCGYIIKTGVIIVLPIFSTPHLSQTFKFKLFFYCTTLWRCSHAWIEMERPFSVVCKTFAIATENSKPVSHRQTPETRSMPDTKYYCTPRSIWVII